ncbi:divalent-cation tolerance protein CutA [Thalassococcus sp. S3]|uniref:divalent-cation tolerance protein CutA n=1 Tax=Thalassococcus sp. S3 TaxID=2017482 RepID=UPI001024645B|nr:divalent-cation tolerance protein CutA [Thalassococcus sp. S3]QBF30285.1 divalent-cation tolerance protein CutA [Thalassococcus sp. S3]
MMILVRINCPDAGVAQQIARGGVEARLAACANIEPPIQSVYHWKCAIETGEETPLILKTRADFFDQIVHLVQQIHPDETPAIIALPVLRTTDAFEAWLISETQST